MTMHYICLVCDRRIERAAFEAHATTHGWNLEQTHQCGYEYDAATRVSTHEFSMRGGPSLFWLIVTENRMKDRDQHTTDPPTIAHTCACGAVTPLALGVTRCCGCGAPVQGDEDGGRVNEIHAA